MRTLLIDADAVAYRDSIAHQRSYDWGDGVTSIATDMPLAKKTIRQQVDKLMSDLEADDLVICLSDDVHNFRKEIDPTYKLNRATVERPVHLYELKAWMGETWPSDLRPRLEADDVMGILSTEPHTGDRIIVSQDKDMMTIPGLLYRPYSAEPEVTEITPAAADRFHLWQTVTGDTVDGYPGAPGAGPQAADLAVDHMLGVGEVSKEITRGPRKGEVDTYWKPKQFENPWHAIVSLYRKAGQTRQNALTQARLARILRNQDYDGRSPILWNPPV